MYGWAGTILRVNLTDRTIKKEPLDEALANKYVGGRGLNSYYLYHEIKPGIDPFGPDNKVMFGVGPACGTILPGSQRWTVTTKSPQTGILGDANCGGKFGVGLKYAGYDMLIVEGVSPKPVYLLVDDDRVEIRDAAFIWGKTTSDTENLIRKELNDGNVDIAVIGPAGENLVRFASVMNDRRAAGRSGCGAVMGSKRLKAVAARGRKGVKPANAKELHKLSREIYANWTANLKGLSSLRERGPGLEAYRAYQEQFGIYPTLNYKYGVYEHYDDVHVDKLKDFWVRNKACFSCPVGCNHMFVVEKGPYTGSYGEGVMTPGMHYAGLIGMHDPSFMFHLSRLSDEYGADEEEFGCLISWLMECQELGILTPDDLDGLDLKWGDQQKTLEVFDLTVNQKGIGKVLSEGAKRAADILGKGSGKYVMHSKGMCFDTRDPRGSKGWALGYAVGSRGADHCRHTMPDFMTGRSPQMSWLETEFENFKLDRFEEEGKARIYRWFEDARVMMHCLEICIFAFESKDIIWSQVMANMFQAITGNEMSARDVMDLGERVTNLERAFNIREGLSRKDDSLPDRMLHEPMPDGPSKGQTINLDLMLDEYYENRGWDIATGYPRRATLEKIGLKDAADELDAMGRLK